jgi:hypothetical protein
LDKREGKTYAERYQYSTRYVHNVIKQRKQLLYTKERLYVGEQMLNGYFYLARTGSVGQLGDFRTSDQK